MIDLFRNIPEAFAHQSAISPQKQIYSQFIPGPEGSSSALRNTLYSEAARRIWAVCRALIDIGLKKGDAVAIISNTRPEWLEADLAILALGGVVVSVYPSLLEKDIAYILWDSGSNVVFVENEEQAQKILNLSKRVIHMPGCEDIPASEQQINVKKIISFERTNLNFPVPCFAELVSAFISDQPPPINPDIQPSDIASIVYTSGTTGSPKGVLQTHANHLANIRQASQAKLYSREDSIYMMLPLAHSFEKLMGYIGFLDAVPLQFPGITDPKSSKLNQRKALSDLSNSSCTVYPLVPRILEKIKEGIELKASDSNLSARLLRVTLDISRKCNKSVLARICRLGALPVRMLLKRRIFGNNFKYAISGGAKLPEEINRFFAGLGIEVLEGYGLTETCVATHCNRPGSNRIGTVGPVLADDILVKIDESGEIMFAGPNIAVGYHQKPVATAKAWNKDGWFHSGDLGTLLPDGCLVITGRKKEIIVTAGGKKVVPEKIEILLRNHPAVSQAVLIGDGRPYCVALLTLSKEGLNKGNFIQSDLENYLNKINSELASFETVKKICILREDFSIENGLLTPTMKTKRAKIMEKYKSAIDRLYSSAEAVLTET